jgi:hypothetical protein
VSDEQSARYLGKSLGYTHVAANRLAGSEESLTAGEQEAYSRRARARDDELRRQRLREAQQHVGDAIATLELVRVGVHDQRRTLQRVRHQLGRQIGATS